MANSPVEKLLSENPKLLELDPPFRGYYPYHSLRNLLKNKLECFLNEEAPYVDSMELFLMIKKEKVRFSAPYKAADFLHHLNPKKGQAVDLFTKFFNYIIAAPNCKSDRQKKQKFDFTPIDALCYSTGLGTHSDSVLGATVVSAFFRKAQRCEEVNNEKTHTSQKFLDLFSIFCGYNNFESFLNTKFGPHYRKEEDLDLQDLILNYRGKTELVPKIKQTPKFEITTEMVSKSIHKPEYLIGRDEDLEKISEILKSKGKVAVTGEGGMGKTSVAAALYHSAMERRCYADVAWLFCEHGTISALSESAPSLGKNLEGLKAEEKLAIITHALKEKGKNLLLVLDNVENDLDDFFQAFQGFDGYVLITSRSSFDWEGLEEYRLPALRNEDAKTLFRIHYSEKNGIPLESGPEFEGLLDQLISAIGYNTLLIELFAKLLKQDFSNTAGSEYGIRQFLGDLEKKGMSFVSGNVYVTTNYSFNRRIKVATIPEILDILYDFSKLDEPSRQLLVNLSLLPAQEFSQEDLLELFVPTETREFRRTLSKLYSQGWIGGDGRKTVRVSPVVQEMTIRKNKETLWEDDHRIIDIIYEKISTIETHNKTKKLSLWDILTHKYMHLNHLNNKTILESLNYLAILATINPFGKSIDFLVSEIKNKTKILPLLKLANKTETENLLNLSLTRILLLTEDSDNIIQARDISSKYCLKKDMTDELYYDFLTIFIYSKIMLDDLDDFKDIKEKIEDEFHKEQLTQLQKDSLLILYLDLLIHKGGKSNLTLAINLAKEFTTINSENKKTAYLKLIDALLTLNDRESTNSAIETIEKLIVIKLNKPEINDFFTFELHSFYGFSLNRIGGVENLTKAKDLFETLIPIAENLFGTKKIIFRQKLRYSLTLNNIGDKNSLEKSLQHLYEIKYYYDLSGEKETTEYFNLIKQILQTLRKLKDTDKLAAFLEICEKTKTIIYEKIGANTQFASYFQYELGLANKAIETQEHLQIAIELFNQSINSWILNYGEDHEQLAERYYHLGVSHQLIGNKENLFKAKLSFIESYTRYSKILNPENPILFYVQYSIADILINLDNPNDLDQAIDLYIRIQEFYEKRFGKLSEKNTSIFIEILNTLITNKKVVEFDIQILKYEEILDKTKEKHTINSTEYDKISYNIIGFYEKMGRITDLERAIEICNVKLSNLSSNIDSNNNLQLKNYLSMKSNLALKLYNSEGQDLKNQALNHLQNVYKISCLNFDISELITTTTGTNYATVLFYTGNIDNLIEARNILKSFLLTNTKINKISDHSYNQAKSLIYVNEKLGESSNLNENILIYYSIIDYLTESHDISSPQVFEAKFHLISIYQKIGGKDNLLKAAQLSNELLTIEIDKENPKADKLINLSLTVASFFLEINTTPLLYDAITYLKLARDLSYRHFKEDHQLVSYIESHLEASEEKLRNLEDPI